MSSASATSKNSSISSNVDDLRDLSKIKISDNSSSPDLPAPPKYQSQEPASPDKHADVTEALQHSEKNAKVETPFEKLHRLCVQRSRKEPPIDSDLNRPFVERGKMIREKLAYKRLLKTERDKTGDELTHFILRHEIRREEAIARELERRSTKLPAPPPDGPDPWDLPPKRRPRYKLLNPPMSKKRKREEELEDLMLDTEILPKMRNRGRKLNDVERAMKMAGLYPEDPDREAKKEEVKKAKALEKAERPWEREKGRAKTRGGRKRAH